MHIKLKIQLKPANTKNSRTAWDILCQTTAEDGSDPNVFVIQVLPKNALNESTDRFSHIADLVDMEDYPSTKDLNKPYYRVSSIVLRVRSQFQAQHVISNIRQDVKELIQAANYMDDQTNLQTIVDQAY